MRRKLLAILLALGCLFTLGGCSFLGNPMDDSSSSSSSEHTHSFTHEFDETNHWEECSCGEKKDVTAHTFEQKKNSDKHWEECSCRAVQNEAKHTYDETKYEVGDTHHWYACTVCEEKVSETVHSYTVDAKNDTHHWKKCVCGKDSATKNDHNQDNGDNNETKHWYICSTCDQVTGEENHTWVWHKDDADKHWKKCSVCGRKDSTTEESHDFATTVKDDPTYHWTVCECGATTNKVTHTYESNVYVNNEDGTHSQICTDDSCKYEKKTECQFTVKSDDTKHWEECVCGAKKGEKDHDFGAYSDNENGTHSRICANADCKYEETKTCSYTYESDDANHWEECTLCHAKKNVTGHSFGAYSDNKDGTHSHTCTFEACQKTVTGNHDDQGSLKNLGADGHKKTCSACAAEVGESIKHTQGDGEWKTNDEQHWKGCACGYADADGLAPVNHKWKDYTVEGDEHSHECSECGKVVSATHEATEWKQDDENDKHYQECEFCGTKINEGDHVAIDTWYNDAENNEHYKLCKCGKKMNVAKHDAQGEWKVEGDEHYKLCECGIEQLKGTHEGQGDWIKTDDGHYKKCVCGTKMATQGHDYKEKTEYKLTADESKHYLEETCVCGAVKTGAEEIHTWGEGWKPIDGTQHTRTCTDCEKVETGNHDHDKYVDNDDDSTHTVKCSICDVTIDGSVKHTADNGEWQANEDDHWKGCACGYSEGGIESHTWANDGELTNDTEEGKHYRQCSTCQYKDYADHVTKDVYKEVDDDKHTVVSTCDCGYSETETVAHNFEGYEKTDASHTQTCTSCGREVNTAHDETNLTVTYEKIEGNATEHTKVSTCNDCGHAIKVKEAHKDSEVWEQDSDKQNHYKVYTCTACGDVRTSAPEKHTLTGEATNVDENVHGKVCLVCGLTGLEAHKITSDHKGSDASGHWNECECGKKGSVESHNSDNWVTTDADNHWKVCSECGYKDETTVQAHDYAWKKADGKHWKECACGKKLDGSEGEHDHKYNRVDDEYHEKVCECGDVQGSKEAHDFKDGDCPCGEKQPEDVWTPYY